MSALEAVFNRVIDIASFFSVITYTFTIFIITKYTPKHMNAFARSLLNIFYWNYSVNLLWMVARPFPMMPLSCFMLKGLVGYINSEILGHVVFAFTLLAVVNVSIALFLCFQLRYMAIAWSRETRNVSTIWFYAYAGFLHVLFSSIYIWFYILWILPADQQTNSNLFCYNPMVIRPTIFLFTLSSSVGIGVATFISLSFYTLKKMRQFMSERTIKMQEALLWNLILLSSECTYTNHSFLKLCAL
ncbi:hypothetical protein QR680_007203 [Steinernema hermaphroditum]|uniref:Uncharacterized protein n=1 Tax=Steinernema hermaphroditum TaxID=289476 RepID=A0AA39I0A1_9BILA|nr:hypothetical protein QR680_007203 [Steinernema hermaphroditum]